MPTDNPFVSEFIRGLSPEDLAYLAESIREQRPIQAEDLPLSNLQRQLEQSWTPRASAFLEPGSVTPDLLDPALRGDYFVACGAAQSDIHLSNAHEWETARTTSNASMVIQVSTAEPSTWDVWGETLVYADSGNWTRVDARMRFYVPDLSAEASGQSGARTSRVMVWGGNVDNGTNAAPSTLRTEDRISLSSPGTYALVLQCSAAGSFGAYMMSQPGYTRFGCRRVWT